MESSYTGTRITNLDYLNQFSNGNDDFVREMIGIFVHENPGEIKRFDKAVREKDFALIRQCAHSLRSTIPFVGLNRHIERELVAMEHLSDKQDIRKIETLYQRVKALCEQAVEELKEEVTQPVTVK